MSSSSRRTTSSAAFRRVLMAMLALVVVVAFSACGDDDSDDDASDDTTEETTDSDDDSGDDSGDASGDCPAPVDEATATTEIIAAMDNFLTEPDPEDKITTVQNGEAILDTLIASTEALAGANPGVSSFNLVVTFTGDTEADFTFDLQATASPGVGLGLSQSGTAVCEDGQWLITPETVCDLTSLGDADLGAQCLEDLG